MHVEDRQNLKRRPVVLRPVQDPDLHTVQLVRGVVQPDRQAVLRAAHPVVGADGQARERVTVHTVSGDPNPTHRGVRHDRQAADRDTGEAAVRDHGKTSDRDTADRAVRHRAETADCEPADRVVGDQPEPGTRPAWIPLTAPVSGSRGFHRVTLMPFTRSSPASWMLMRRPFTRGALPTLMPQSWIVSPTWK